MAEGFDAYHAWLGIPPEEQPPNCYRLLSIPLFEDRPEVIQHAADQRMAQLKSLGAGKHAAWAQRLLKEVAGARVRLLDPYKKAIYDQRLRQELGAREAGRGTRGEGPGGQAFLPVKEQGQPSLPANVAHPPAAARPPEPPVAQPPPDVPQQASPTPPADQPTATWAPLGKLGDYQLLEKLGEGGMGTVYKAIHGKLGRLVALKVLSKDRRWDQHAIARFDREMKAVGAVDHPNIVRAMDAREVDGTRFLVMEYVEGLDLNALGRACHPIAIADACEIIRQAALGLEEVHRRGLVHRDVKPSNLMVTPEGVVKLLDLGLARFGFERAVDDEVTGMGVALGTVDYMAPEQVTDSRSVDIRADIYSLGCTFYKLLAGRTPFGGPEHRSLMERVKAHAREPVPPVKKFRGDVPPEVVHVLRRMLEKDPDKRFSTPAEVADAVGPFTATGDLAALVAQARRGGQASVAQASLPVAADHRPQAEVATAESRSPSSVTRFFQQIVESPSATTGGHPPSAAPKWRKNIPTIISLGAMGVLCVVALLIWAFTRGGKPVVGPAVPDTAKTSAGKAGPTAASRQSCLVLQWPSDARGSAMLEINGQVQDLAAMALTSSASEIRIPLKPGGHKVSVRRLGYEPFEQTFTLAENRDTVLRPMWKESGAGGQAFLPVPSVGQASLPADAKKEPPSEPKKEVVQEPPPVIAKSEPPKPQEDPILKRRRELAATWTKAMGPVEAMIAAWDFAAAQEAVKNVRFDEPELTARLAARREALPKMAAFKQRITEKINAASPPLKKFAIGLSGQNGDVVKADHEAITAKTPSRGLELHRWPELSEKALPKVLQLVVNQGGRESPSMSAKDGVAGGKTQPPTSKETPDPFVEDLLTAGALSITIADPVSAEKHFETARSLGANIDAYLAPLAEAVLARAEGLLAAKQFAQAEKALCDLETRYAQLPWFAANKPAVTAARDVAKAGIVRNQEAENLYAEAARLFSKKELFDVKALVEKLKSEYADTDALRDRRRRPSLVELEKAVAGVRKPITVRLDGKGDFKGIQAAIDAAPSASLIEIEDNGPYHEKLLIPKDKYELRVRGKKGCWPVVTSSQLPAGERSLVTVEGTGAFLERLVLLHDNFLLSHRPPCVAVLAGDFRLRWAIVHSVASGGIDSVGYQQKFGCEECFVTAGASANAPAAFRNCLFLGIVEAGHLFHFQANGCEAQFCTILPGLTPGGGWLASRVRDSVVGSAQQGTPFPIENCAVLAGQVPDQSRACFKADPMFVDPKNFDYRLKPGSPCIGKASDGGDIGCRYTPEMIELCKVALELRRRGILKF